MYLICISHSILSISNYNIIHLFSPINMTWTRTTTQIQPKHTNLATSALSDT
ncbi:hypothetical protein F383_21674 [Gossypium arboreum]|uniref:Uncharacterized protein n=1 Tax=Gossypium arboreum TaxID=29729 RepID=A0A0B0NMK8_GOSAR|nr:hypothetical protein F383_21674 [Gossypium arboreum]